MGFANLLLGQDRNTDGSLVIHTINEKPSIVNSPTKSAVYQTPKYSISDIRKPGFVMPLINHTKNEALVVVEGVKSDTKVTTSPLVILTVENRDVVLSKMKLTEHTKKEESEITSTKRN